MSSSEYLDTAEVAHRLGVKPETVYAYVSRGLLRSVRARGRRSSMFAAEEVERLLRRDPRRRPAPAGRLADAERIRSRLTLLADDELYFRGYRATELAATHSPESVAQLLWTGELAEQPPFPSSAGAVALARQLIDALPGSARRTDQLRVAVIGLGAADPLRFDLSSDAVAATARRLIGNLVDALANTAAASTSAGVGRRLWPALSPDPEPPGLLDAALVLLADHELAVSTLAGRVAASARAHPYAVVSAALGALDARYHGAASTLAYRFLTDALLDPLGALAEQLRTGDPVPGYGHRLYRGRDPRGEYLLRMLRRQTEAGPVLAALDAVTQQLGQSQFPSVDVALAAMMHAYRMGPDAGEAIFAIARIAGWIGHALEEYREPPLRLRIASEYTGPAP
ncbi:MAG TPA: citrate synthase [Pseudonocardia sp.]|jgi:citrate synthase|uniref:citrate synthase n=1 Tax=Pseudonocardia sp. TaxID=60912 RepID=UPI002F3E7B0D